MQTESLTALFLLLSVVFLVGAGMIRRPGIGIIGTFIIIAYLGFSQPDGFAAFGFQTQENWIATVFLAFAIGTLLAIIALAFIEPLAESVTGQPHDITIVAAVRGNFAMLMQWLLVVWVLVGFIEELIYRGYLMTAFTTVFGFSPAAVALSLLFSSLVFGLSHYYQGASGAISATIVGVILGIVFIAMSYNLWLVILVHGFIDTVQLIVIFYNKDHAIRGWLT